MRSLRPLSSRLRSLSDRVRPRVRERVALVVRSEQGDVPGWVLVTLMTAGLVVVLWGLAGPALAEIFENAIAKVAGI